LSRDPAAPTGSRVDASKPPAIRPAFVLRFGAIGAYLLLVFLQLADQEDGTGGPLQIAALGFALGVLIGRWWGLAIGAVALLIGIALTPDGSNAWVFAWYLLALQLPGAIAFGVLGARLRRADPSMAARVITAGAGLLLIAALGFAIFASGYDDDGPNPVIVGWGFVAAVLLGPPGVGLFLAGVVGALPTRQTPRTERNA
jgi:hypothetical protein